MAENEDLPGSNTEAEKECYDENSLFDIELHPTGDDGSSYRMRNDPLAPHQRPNIVERKGAIDIRCNCLDVIHGLLTPENYEDRATLIVLQFNFDRRKLARRVATADIKLVFSTSSPGEDDPEVIKIAPSGSMAMVPTTAQQEERRTAGFKLGAPPLAGLEAGTELGWEKTITSDTTNLTCIVGSMDLKGRNYGPNNRVWWTLLENEREKTGIPTVLRTEILLKRRNDAKFQCTLKLKTKVDFKSRLQRMIGGREKDDPVLFDPDMEHWKALTPWIHPKMGAAVALAFAIWRP